MPTSPRRISGSPPVNRTSVTPEPLHRDPDEPHHLVVGELLLARQPGEALLGHAVGAAQIAPVGQRDPQVGGHPPEAVGQPERGQADRGPALAGPSTTLACSLTDRI